MLCLQIIIILNLIKVDFIIANNVNVVTYVVLDKRIYRDISQSVCFWCDAFQRHEHRAVREFVVGTSDRLLQRSVKNVAMRHTFPICQFNYSLLIAHRRAMSVKKILFYWLHSPGTFTTSSYVTKSSWSNTALCFAKYLSRHCFFLRLKMEQLTAERERRGRKWELMEKEMGIREQMLQKYIYFNRENGSPSRN